MMEQRVRIIKRVCFIVTILLLNFSFTNSGSITFGRNYPHGNSAVTYLYCSRGTWREMKGLQYRENKFYHVDNPISHPTNKNLDTSTLLLTYKDEEGNLLCDFNIDGEIDSNNNGWAFHAHKGHLPNGSFTTPDYSFLYDVNFLGTIMADAYGTDFPYGIYNPLSSRYRTKYNLLKEVTQYYEISTQQDVFSLAFNGFYYILISNYSAAISAWNSIRAQIGGTYNGTHRIYLNFTFKNYEEQALALILISSICKNTSCNLTQRRDYISLRAHVVSTQKLNSGNGGNFISSPYIGDFSGWVNSSGIISTKETILNILALSANDWLSFEVNHKPMNASHRSLFTFTNIPTPNNS